jgi:hypothetical protein
VRTARAWPEQRTTDTVVAWSAMSARTVTVTVPYLAILHSVVVKESEL